MEKQNIQGLIPGCTEFPVLFQHQSCTYPVFKPTKIHAGDTVDFTPGTHDFS